MKKLKKIMSIILSVLCIASVFCGSTISVECKEYDFDASTNNIKLESGFEEVELEQNNISEENSNVERFFAVLEESKLNSGAYTGEYWKAFSSPYYTYANKLSQGQKELYDRLYNSLYNLIESEYDFQIYEGLYYTPAVEFHNLTVEQVNDVATLMLYEHPELFYLNNRILVNYSGNNGTVRISIYDDFADGENRIALANQMKGVIAFYLSYVDSFSTLLDKEKACHDIIAAQIFYDINCKYGQSCASVFLEKKSVCAGYSEAFCMLCNASGIPAISVTSDNHEWSEVKLGKYWYAVDVTWDDCYGAKYYLNKSDEGLKWIDTELYRDYRNCHVIENCWNRIGREACLYNYGDEPQEVLYPGIFMLNYTYNNVAAGLVINNVDSNQLDYSWMVYDIDLNRWYTISDWQQGNPWVSWNPGKSGKFLLYGQVRWHGNTNVAGNSCIGIVHKYYIKDICQTCNPYGPGFLLGETTNDNPNNSYRYEILVLDCSKLAAGDPYPWVYTTGKMDLGGGTTAWAVWQPTYGFYWTLFRVYDTRGNLLDEECFGFVNT